MAPYQNILLLLIPLLASLAHAQLPVDNGIVGDPEIECLSHTMSIRFTTRNPFQGHVFVRQHYNDEDCHKDYIMNQETGGFMHLEFDKCGMRRQRTANPRGMTMSAVVIVSFHRTFITHVDKAYHIECFYLEEEKIVDTELKVSSLPTTDLDMNPPMPTCIYQVLSGGPDGDSVTFARVGDQVYHKWTCEYPMADMYCMLIHSCTVDDGDQAQYEVVDKDGCAKDTAILDNLAYTTDLVAGVEANVFKFADQSNVYFTCQVSLSLKNEAENGVCPRPSCNAPAVDFDSPQRRLRFRRNASSRTPSREISLETAAKNDFDVVAPPLTVLEIDENLSVEVPNSGERRRSSLFPAPSVPFVPALLGAEAGDPTGVCLSGTSFGILMAAALLSCCSTILFAVVYCLRTRSGKS